MEQVGQRLVVGVGIVEVPASSSTPAAGLLAAAGDPLEEEVAYFFPAHHAGQATWQGHHHVVFVYLNSRQAKVEDVKKAKPIDRVLRQKGNGRTTFGWQIFVKPHEDSRLMPKTLGSTDKKHQEKERDHGGRCAQKHNCIHVRPVLQTIPITKGTYYAFDFGTEKH